MRSSPRRVFVSYSHCQGAWVLDRLVPVLRAGGAEVLIDRERFTAGRELRGQMDATQDGADVNVLVLSPEYLASESCVHEMERAIARPSWLAARDEMRRFLERGQSVNLVVDGNVAWRELLADLQRGNLADLVQVNLEKPATASRRGLAAEILRAFGMTAPVPPEPEDLAELDRFLSARQQGRLALTHFDLAAHRPAYGIDLFAALRYLVMDSRQLVLLVQSRRPFATLLPEGHPLSAIDLKTVELRGR
jgi:TIR domain-containing protein